VNQLEIEHIINLYTFNLFPTQIKQQMNFQLFIYLTFIYLYVGVCGCLYII